MKKHLINALFMPHQSLTGCFHLRLLPQGKDSAKFSEHSCPITGHLPLNKTHIICLAVMLQRFSVSFSDKLSTCLGGVFTYTLQAEE